MSKESPRLIDKKLVIGCGLILLGIIAFAQPGDMAEKVFPAVVGFWSMVAGIWVCRDDFLRPFDKILEKLD